MRKEKSLKQDISPKGLFRWMKWGVQNGSFVLKDSKWRMEVWRTLSLRRGEGFSKKGARKLLDKF